MTPILSTSLRPRDCQASAVLPGDLAFLLDRFLGLQWLIPGHANRARGGKWCAGWTTATLHLC